MDSGREDKEWVRAVLHLAFICELYEMQVHGGRYFLHTHSHSADSWEQSPLIDLMNRFPDTFQTVTDRSLFDPNVPGKMIALTKWLTNSGCVAQALSSLSHLFSVRQTMMSAMSRQLQSDLCVAGTSNPPQTRPTLPKLDILAVDADQGLSEEWERERHDMRQSLCQWINKDEGNKWTKHSTIHRKGSMQLPTGLKSLKTVQRISTPLNHLSAGVHHSQ